jgi:hypothetical protein
MVTANSVDDIPLDQKREWNRMVTTMQAILNEPS